MVATKEKPRLQKQYEEAVAPATAEKFSLRNKHQVPRIMKIVVNCGVGKFLENQKLKPETRDAVIETIVAITGQRPIVVLAKKSVSNFKVREGSPSGIVVTLRRDRMWSFLDRLINLAVPRIRDFRGLKDNSFDKEGNYSMGLHEQAVWPEINMARATLTHGMHVNVVFDRSTPEMSKFMLAELGMPFVRKE